MDLTFPQCANVILHQFFHKWSRKRLGQLHKHYCTGTVKEQWIFCLTEPLDSSKARAEKWEIGTSLQTPFASESQINSVPWLCARNLDPFWFKNWEKGNCVYLETWNVARESGHSLECFWFFSLKRPFSRFLMASSINPEISEVWNWWRYWSQGSKCFQQVKWSSLRAAWRWLLTNISLSMVNKPRRQWWGGAYVGRS